MDKQKNTAEELVDSVLTLEKMDYHSSMEPFSSYAARRKAVLLERLEEEAELFSNGYRYILEDLRKQAEVPLEDYVLSEERLSIFHDEEKMKEAREEKKSYQEILEISDDQMLIMYQAAARYFESEQYKESAAAFTFLTKINDSVSAFWIGLGSSYRAMHDLDNALVAYYDAIMADVIDIESYKYAASCYLEMNDHESAEGLFKAAIDFVEASDDSNDPDMQDFKEQAQKYLEVLERGGV